MAYDFSLFKKRISEIETWLSKEYSVIRTGRATPVLLDAVYVEAYGSRQPLKHVASISIEDPRTLRISPWDKALVKPVEQGLRGSNLGISVSVDDSGIRVGFPDLTEETRKSLLKVIRNHLEEAKISLRKERERLVNELEQKEKAKEISEDDKFRLKDELQKLVDKAGENFETLASKKEKEIATI